MIISEHKNVTVSRGLRVSVILVSLIPYLGYPSSTIYLNIILWLIMAYKNKFQFCFYILS